LARAAAANAPQLVIGDTARAVLNGRLA